ncbi:hypothetical protein AAS21_gp085 [Pantoea phage vB_PagS_AAS21]|uniref:Uncharacterized protein n=1 Tax=Pantoea phage vB_PagS_AAS21 TaxID=2575261 RepID=A0A4Y5P1V9_9CAUD|nr:hypothetical protein AAS21_gp085 [Pantoea phage vB_PagS_AAS21]
MGTFGRHILQIWRTSNDGSRLRFR